MIFNYSKRTTTKTDDNSSVPGLIDDQMLHLNRGVEQQP